MSPRINWEKAIDNAIVRYGLKTEAELTEYFIKAGVRYPPKEMALLAFKSERHIELWAHDDETPWTYIHRYPLTAYSGKLGPKLREHDRQIPEGIYRLVSFNPFSSMHLSMMINYPNAFDSQHAQQEHRKKPGNNIFLHGKAESVGCLAVGNAAIDQLFLLVRRVGLDSVKLIIAPNDLRKSPAKTDLSTQPKWLPKLYAEIKKELNSFRRAAA
ncbi:MAG: L,D-transpeptidase family protein [Legionellaceae bacterium]|nr:L,D-transpeptidase family protein [Legionellaceae bacterium]